MMTAIIDTKEVQKMMWKMGRAGKNMKPLMTRFYGKVNMEVHKNFQTQSYPPDILSGPAGNTRRRWKPISSYTAAARLGSRTSTSSVGGILQANGLLMASMGKVRIITNSSMTYGTPEWLSEVHHFGKVIRPKRSKYLALPYPGITGSPRDYDNTFVKGKTIYRTHPMNPSGPPQRLFFLKESVTIPARPHMTISSRAIDWMASQTSVYMLQKAGR